MIEILIVDDHTLVRQGLKQILEDTQEIRVVGEAPNGREAIEQVKLLRPNIILMDIHMPEMDGIVATHRITSQYPECNVIILTMYGDEEHLFEAVKAGAKGYLLKEIHSDALVETIHTVHRGEAWLEPSMASKMLAEFRTPRKSHEEKIHLTSRETSILELLSKGTSNHDIAKQLNLAEKTVRNRLSQIFSKLHVNNRTEAALKAREEGILKKNHDSRSG